MLKHHSVSGQPTGTLGVCVDGWEDEDGECDDTVALGEITRVTMTLVVMICVLATCVGYYRDCVFGRSACDDICCGVVWVW